jgi:hypothetical protein
VESGYTAGECIVAMRGDHGLQRRWMMDGGARRQRTRLGVGSPQGNDGDFVRVMEMWEGLPPVRITMKSERSWKNERKMMGWKNGSG